RCLRSAHALGGAVDAADAGFAGGVAAAPFRGAVELVAAFVEGDATFPAELRAAGRRGARRHRRGIALERRDDAAVLPGGAAAVERGAVDQVHGRVVTATVVGLPALAPGTGLCGRLRGADDLRNGVALEGLDGPAAVPGGAR